MIRVETKGSIWMLDDMNHRYARMPKHEGPRWSPPGEDWGGPGAGALEDLKWHPMIGWEIKHQSVPQELFSKDPMLAEMMNRLSTSMLVIDVDEEQRITAPDARIAE